MLEAKEENQKLRADFDAEVKERRNELNRQERRINQKEENLDKKTDNLEKKEQTLSQKLKSLESKEKEKLPPITLPKPPFLLLIFQVMK